MKNYSNTQKKVNCPYLISLFSDHVEAAVRVLGCVCDSNESWTLDMEEINSPNCQAIQEFMFGQNCDQACFDYVDTNQDGELQGEEVAIALEAMHENDETAAGR